MSEVGSRKSEIDMKTGKWMEGRGNAEEDRKEKLVNRKVEMHKSDAERQKKVFPRGPLEREKDGEEKRE